MGTEILLKKGKKHVILQPLCSSKRHHRSSLVKHLLTLETHLLWSLGTCLFLCSTCRTLTKQCMEVPTPQLPPPASISSWSTPHYYQTSYIHIHLWTYIYIYANFKLHLHPRTNNTAKTCSSLPFHTVEQSPSFQLHIVKFHRLIFKYVKNTI